MSMMATGAASLAIWAGVGGDEVCGAANVVGLAVWFWRRKGKYSVSVRAALNFIILGGCVQRIVHESISPRVSLELARRRFRSRLILVELVLLIFFGSFSGGWSCPSTKCGLSCK